jgi:hypothetical protein
MKCFGMIVLTCSLGGVGLFSCAVQERDDQDKTSTSSQEIDPQPPCNTGTGWYCTSDLRYNIFYVPTWFGCEARQIQFCPNKCHVFPPGQDDQCNP